MLSCKDKRWTPQFNHTFIWDFKKSFIEMNLVLERKKTVSFFTPTFYYYDWQYVSNSRIKMSLLAENTKNRDAVQILNTELNYLFIKLQLKLVVILCSEYQPFSSFKKMFFGENAYKKFEFFIIYFCKQFHRNLLLWKWVPQNFTCCNFWVKNIMSTSFSALEWLLNTHACRYRHE